ncbi:hypothetical protein STEG23_010770, partial [Scotinomys teguina]
MPMMAITSSKYVITHKLFQSSEQLPIKILNQYQWTAALRTESWMCQLSWFLDPGGWGKAAVVGLYFIFPGICTLSLESTWRTVFARAYIFLPLCREGCFVSPAPMTHPSRLSIDLVKDIPEMHCPNEKIQKELICMISTFHVSIGFLDAGKVKQRPLPVESESTASIPQLSALYDNCDIILPWGGNKKVTGKNIYFSVGNCATTFAAFISLKSLNISLVVKTIQNAYNSNYKKNRSIELSEDLPALTNAPVSVKLQVVYQQISLYPKYVAY